jgi:FKBP-type peptidyl-prolyl cis-trans isomerase SlyD
MSAIAANRVVHVHYLATEVGGAVLDASGVDPIAYLHGHGAIVPGLERALEGKGVGDEVDVTIEPADAYGVLDEAAYFPSHRRDLPPGTRLEVGAPFRATGSNGRAMVFYIHRVQGARCTVTTNHPLAGKTIRVQCQVAAIRNASTEEIAHGHVHEPGHAHH